MESDETKDIKEYPNYILHYKNKEWVVYDGDVKSIKQKSLNIMTYNVWFSSYFYKERAKELFKQILKLKVDIACLQEVTLSFIKLLKESKLRKKGYYISDYNQVQFDYGVLIISKFPPSEIKIYPMESRMGRCVMIANFLINETNLYIGTVHLESLMNHKKRRNQLKFIKSIMKNYSNSLLMGDFNFDSEKNYIPSTEPLENDNLKEIYPEYIDVWSHLNPNDPGKTFDTTKNDLLSDHNHEVMRYDRIIMKSECWVPQKIEMVGTSPFMVDEKSKKNVHISDHFGLFLNIQIK